MKSAATVEETVTGLLSSAQALSKRVVSSTSTIVTTYGIRADEQKEKVKTKPFDIQPDLLLWLQHFEVLLVKSLSEGLDYHKLCYR